MLPNYLISLFCRLIKPQLQNKEVYIYFFLKLIYLLIFCFVLSQISMSVGQWREYATMATVKTQLAATCVRVLGDSSLPGMARSVEV